MAKNRETLYGYEEATEQMDQAFCAAAAVRRFGMHGNGDGRGADAGAGRAGDAG